MSAHNPSNWTEIATSVQAGWGFNATRHGVVGQPIFVLSDVRGMLYGHLDDFAREVIAANDRTRAAYMETGSREYGPDDFVYVVARDGNAIAALTQSGRVVVNPAVSRGGRRYRDAVRWVAPALERGAVWARRDAQWSA